jgi:beta-glucosidase
LYTSDLVASVVPAVKQLRRFQKVEIAQGETRKVDFTLTEKDLAFVNMKNEWVTEAGEFKITIDTFSVNFYLQN